MELLAKLDEFKTFPSGKQRLGRFLCPGCGTSVIRTVSHGKRDTSCGCTRSQGALNGRWKAGVTKHPLYFVHSMILQRCRNPHCKDWPLYGKRGIHLCNEWLDAAAFITWAETNGWSAGLTIDRKNNDGPYAPDNCRWVSNQINSQNTRRTKISLTTATAIKTSLQQGMAAAEAATLHHTTIHIVSDIKRGRTWTNA